MHGPFIIRYEVSLFLINRINNSINYREVVNIIHITSTLYMTICCMINKEYQEHIKSVVQRWVINKEDILQY
jgi:hypothetical protein